MKQKRSFLLFSALIFCITLLYAEPMPFTLNFETGNLDGWTKSGRAFAFQPTKDDNVEARGRNQVSNHKGYYWIGTYERYQGQPRQKPGTIQGDGPTGRLTSAAFTIVHNRLSFLIGGGADHSTRVELLINDKIEQTYITVKQVSGENRETMHRVDWDITPYKGKKAKLRIVDDSSKGWGHINVDDFRFYNTEIVKPEYFQAQNPAVFQPMQPVTETRKTEVPNLIGKNIKTAFELLEEYSLKLGEITKRVSDEKADTVLEQNPQPETSVIPNTRVDVWIAQRPQLPPLEARIEPSELHVIQGSAAHFTSSLNLTHTIDMQQEWKSSDGQYAKGADFSPDTSMIKPGTYTIQLVVRRGHEWSEANALLHVESRPIEYRLDFQISPVKIKQHHFIQLTANLIPEHSDTRYQFDFGDGSPVKTWSSQKNIEHRYDKRGIFYPSVHAKTGNKSFSKEAKLIVEAVDYAVTLNSNKETIQENNTVVFEVKIKPFGNNIKYRYHFGDGLVSEWIAEAKVEHHYRTAGKYAVYVEIEAEGEIFKSNDVSLLVEKEISATDTESSSEFPPLWIFISAAAGFLIVSGGVFYGVRSWRNPIKMANVDFRLIQGESHQHVEADSDIIDTEISIEVIKDIGRQNIENGGNIIEKEWSSDEEQ